MSSPDVRVSNPAVSLWRNRDYILLLAGQFISTLGSGISGFAFPLLVLVLTHSPATAGLIDFTGGVPYIILSLPAGALVDRWNRKTAMIVCDCVRAIAIGIVPLAALVGPISLALLFAVALVQGTAFVVFNIAEAASLPRVVAKDQLPAATGINQAAFISSGLASSPLAGLIFQALGRTIPFVFDAVSYVASVLSLCFIRAELQDERTGGERMLRVEIREGLTWLWQEKLIRYLAFLSGGLNLASSARFLVLVVLAQSFHASPATIGILLALGSAGGVLGSLTGPWFQRRFSLAQVVVGCVWVEALLWPLYAVAPNPIALGLIQAGVVLAGPIYNVAQFSYRAALVPDMLQGRVNSAVRMIAYGFEPLGAAISGLTIQSIGPRGAVLGFAAVLLFLALSTTVNPHLRAVRNTKGG